MNQSPATNHLVRANGVTYESKYFRRFYRHVRTIVWGKGPVYLRVSYGQGINQFKEKTFFYNDGEYTNKKDFMQALSAFLDDKKLT